VLAGHDHQCSRPPRRGLETDDTEAQDHHLQIIRFGLQRAAGQQRKCSLRTCGAEDQNNDSSMRARCAQSGWDEPWARRAQKLAGGNVAIALLCNTIPTGAILVVLILIFAPISGAHFNPAVSIAFALQRELPWSMAAGYIAAQIIGAVVGVWAAHFMFELPVWQFSVTSRAGAGRWLAEAVATFGLLLTICGCAARRRPPFPTRSASTSPWPIGSPHRHLSPIQP
jgi:hypothetical protein